eukprot:scaffold10768_cov32-Phaeocystis_antarctica.AAC.2
MDMLSSAKLARGGEQEMSSRWVEGAGDELEVCRAPLRTILTMLTVLTVRTLIRTLPLTTPRWVADLFGPNAADGDHGEDVAKVMRTLTLTPTTNPNPNPSLSPIPQP